MPSVPHPRLQPPPVNQRSWLHQPIGLGDAVHAAARPVVFVVKALGGPNLAGCAGCGQRRKDWNASVPNVNPLANK